MKCIKCRTELQNGTKYCPECGNKVHTSEANETIGNAEMYCIDCGAGLSTNAKFCTTCGKSIIATEAATPSVSAMPEETKVKAATTEPIAESAVAAAVPKVMEGQILEIRNKIKRNLNLSIAAAGYTAFVSWLAAKEYFAIQYRTVGTIIVTLITYHIIYILLKLMGMFRYNDKAIKRFDTEYNRHGYNAAIEYNDSLKLSMIRKILIIITLLLASPIAVFIVDIITSINAAI